MFFQLSTVETLLPPNFIATQRESGYGVSTLCVTPSARCTNMLMVSRAPA
jgi:hypothetical protein